MSDTKFTKGPLFCEWVPDEKTPISGYTSIRDGNNEERAVVYCTHGFVAPTADDPYSMWVIENTANAHLIAAAPLGFEAADAAYKALLRLPLSACGWRINNQMVYVMLRDYIASAIGRSAQDVQDAYESEVTAERIQVRGE